VARRLGAPGFEQDGPAAIMAEASRLTPSYGGISHERLDRGDVLAWPCPAPDHPGTPILHREKFTRGKGKFFAVHWRPPQEVPDAGYPLRLTTGRTMFHYHTGTMTRRVPLLNHEVPTGYVEINPRDAAAAGVADGEVVEVRSRRGAIDLGALVTERVPPGTVFIPFHFAECAANALTNAALDPEAKIPEFKVCAVRVAKRKQA
jgi:formate dehydrogenase major subunit/formate dehydrogenase alpha subunit